MKQKSTFEIEKFFLALSDRTRLRLLNLMRDGEVCVCFFTEILQEPQSKISRHLAYLRSANLVTARREGKWMHYQLQEPTDAEAAHIFAAVKNWMLQQPQMLRDAERLHKVCCAPRLPVQLQGAPRPVRA